MIGYSSQAPEQIVQHDGGYQFRYNIEQIERNVDEEPVMEWQYDYVNVTTMDRSTLIDALITSKYSYPAQLGKLALDRESAEWSAYEAFRESVYTLVDSALAET